jgi:uncharacterized damage-inducible protein DinB
VRCLDLLEPQPEGKDPWTVKDALAHITHWKADVIRSIHGQRRPAEQQGPSGNEVNHFICKRWQEQTPRDVLAWHRQVQEDLVHALQRAPEKWFSGREKRAEWPYDLVGHSVYHRSMDIERALASRANK